MQHGGVTLVNMPRGSQPVSGPFAAAVSAEVRAEKARQRLTDKELAEAAGLSPSYLGKRLRDEAPLTLNDIQAICAALHVPLGQMLSSAASEIE
jgi:transcriptional regulator with XRE-family HTH domain